MIKSNCACSTAATWENLRITRDSLVDEIEVDK